MAWHYKICMCTYVATCIHIFRLHAYYVAYGTDLMQRRTRIRAKGWRSRTHRTCTRILLSSFALNPLARALSGIYSRVYTRVCVLCSCLNIVTRYTRVYWHPSELLQEVIYLFLESVSHKVSLTFSS